VAEGLQESVSCRHAMRHHVVWRFVAYFFRAAQ
jgi:hypothetical protein